MEYVVVALVSLILGGVAGFLVYNNNKGKSGALVEKAEAEIKDLETGLKEVKKKMKNIKDKLDN